MNDDWEREVKFQTDLEPVKQILTEVLVESEKWMTKRDLHNRLFYIKYFGTKEFDTTLDCVQFTPIMYGMFSVEVSYALNEFEDEFQNVSQIDMRREKLLTVYNIPSESDRPDTEKPAEDVRKVIKQGMKKLRGVSESDLVSWVKNSEVFNEAEYGEPLPTYLLETTPLRFSADKVKN